MTVEEVRQFIYTIANKDQTGDLPSPEQLNTLMARAVEEKFKVEYGLRSVQNGIFYQNSQNSTDALSNFITALPVNATVPGVFVLPTNYVHVSSIGYIDNGKNRVVTIVNEDEWNSRLDNVMIPPTEKYPIAKFISGALIVYPTTIATINLTYLKKPATPVWGYTVVNDEPVYNAGTSTQIDFPEMYHIDIARIILSYMGIEFRDEYLTQYAEVTKNQGS